MRKPKIGIIISSIRAGRFGDRPARWMLERASRRADLDFEIIDLRDYPLPLFEEPSGPTSAPSRHEVAQRWAQALASCDGFIFITAEYNHSITGALKNALDYVYTELNRKPAAFVGYGSVGSARAIQQLRLICVELQMAPLRHAVHIGRETYAGVARQGQQLADFDFLNSAADKLLHDLAWWTHTLRAGRDGAAGI